MNDLRIGPTETMPCRGAASTIAVIANHGWCTYSLEAANLGDGGQALSSTFDENEILDWTPDLSAALCTPRSVT
jgi:hypothetical protein